MGINNIRLVVLQQTEDEGLWFKAQTAPEEYLQMKLRDLHRIVENEFAKNGGDDIDEIQKEASSD